MPNVLSAHGPPQGSPSFLPAGSSSFWKASAALQWLAPSPQAHFNLPPRQDLFSGIYQHMMDTRESRHVVRAAHEISQMDIPGM